MRWEYREKSEEEQWEVLTGRRLVNRVRGHRFVTASGQLLAVAHGKVRRVMPLGNARTIVEGVQRIGGTTVGDGFANGVRDWCGCVCDSVYGREGTLVIVWEKLGVAERRLVNLIASAASGFVDNGHSSTAPLSIIIKSRVGNAIDVEVAVDVESCWMMEEEEECEGGVRGSKR
ncbi:unnamed protein product [Hymenolepis diminuta]|nr:unnamed protein product [Hymenolepis diminuta]